jgi:hypothetical protein
MKEEQLIDRHAKKASGPKTPVIGAVYGFSFLTQEQDPKEQNGTAHAQQDKSIRVEVLRHHAFGQYMVGTIQ